MAKKDKKLKLFRVTVELRHQTVVQYVLAPRLQDCPKLVREFYEDEPKVLVITVSRVPEEEGVLP